jgi:hypothetical protein
MSRYTRFNIHLLSSGRCIWRLYYRGILIARSIKGWTFKNGREAKQNAKVVLAALKTLDLG